VTRLRDPGRLAALTDGVFAIVLTILVLEIDVPPDLDEKSLRAVLEHLRPTIVAWITSFLIVGMYWSAHRDLFARLRSASRDIVWIHLLYLLPVCLIPFGAALIGEYPNEPIALHLYGVIVIAATLLRLAMFGYIVRRPWLLWDQEVDREAWLGFLIAAVPIVPYVVAMVIASWSTGWSRACFAAGPILYFVVITILRGRASTRAEAEEFD
jgi:uncharacterized membrane protein